MTRVIRASVVIALVIVSGLYAAHDAAAQLVTPRFRVAVMDLNGSALKMQTAQMPNSQGGTTSQTTISIPPPAEFARSLTEALTTSLAATGKFTVLERAALQQVQQEQDLDASGRVNTQTAAEKGKLLGAQMLITGDITGFTYNHSAIGGKLTNIIKGLDAGVERVTASVSIDLRLIDAVTGEVIASIKGDGSASQQGVTGHLTRDEKKYDGSVAMSTPLGKASREAIEKSIAGIIDNVPKLKWGARVIDFRDGVVYVNAGEGSGLIKGMSLEVFDAQPTLIDPETGRNLGSPEKLIGEVMIQSIEPQYSTAKVVSGAEFKRNQVVRFKGEGAKQ
jgi:curli biogenesis system outer membrane secretion channel CsgG